LRAPEPTALQLDFIRASEEEAEVRSSAQRKQLQAMAAAQAERETALDKAEEALKQVARSTNGRGSEKLKLAPGDCASGVSLTSSMSLSLFIPLRHPPGLLSRLCALNI
jgi:hypothetical protein